MSTCIVNRAKLERYVLNIKMC
uniref:Uncharacterized protein n=1 Tax=Anguilla anguilla TaxID=7936 RepID=A0A0E9R0N2_ANGAN